MNTKIKFHSYGMYGVRADCQATADIAGELDCYTQDNENWTTVEKLVIKNIEFRFTKSLVMVRDGDDGSVDWDVFPASFWEIFPNFVDDFKDTVIETIKIECNRSGRDTVDL